MSIHQMLQVAAAEGLVCFILPDGTWLGTGTRAELDALIADDILPPETITRAVTKEDLA